MNNANIFNDILNQKISEDEIREFLITLYNKGVTKDDILKATKAMRSVMSSIDTGDEINADDMFDIVGTGGDKSNSINISSTSSLLLSACGVLVAKHGSISATSKSGSADMLQKLGINIELNAKQIIQMLKTNNYAFIFARNFHPALAPLAPIRKSIPHGTIFNILGPLCNPLRVKKMLLGVYDKSLVKKMAEVFLSLGGERILCVNSNDGLDEISLCDNTYGIIGKKDDSSKDGFVLEEIEINPREYGFELCTKDELKGSDAQYNANITKDILSGECMDAKRDVVVLNTAFALMISGKVGSIKDGISLANEAIDSKMAQKHLDNIIKNSNSF